MERCLCPLCFLCSARICLCQLRLKVRDSYFKSFLKTLCYFTDIELSPLVEPKSRKKVVDDWQAEFLLKRNSSPFRSWKLKSDIYFLQIRPKEGKDEAASKPIHTGATRNVTTNMRNLNFVSPTYSPLVAATLTPTTTLTTTWTPRRSLRRATSRRRSSRGWAAATSTGGSTTARAAPASATCTTTNPSHPRTHFKLNIRSSGRTPPATSSFIQVGFSNIQKTTKSMFRRMKIWITNIAIKRE